MMTTAPAAISNPVPLTTTAISSATISSRVVAQSLSSTGLVGETCRVERTDTPSTCVVEPLGNTWIMGFEARRAFPEGLGALLQVLAFIAFVGAMVLVAAYSPESVQLAAFGVLLGVLGASFIAMLISRILGADRSRKATLVGLAVWMELFPPVWIGFCTYRGTGSWPWTVVAGVGGFVSWEVLIAVYKRGVGARTPGGGPRSTPKSRRRAAPTRT